MDNLFEHKRKYIGYDGDEYINLSLPSIDISKIKAISTLSLSKDYEGRIDKLTWNEVSRNFDAIDVVMYANHIFNPFAIEQGEVFYIPTDNDNLYFTMQEPTLPDGTLHSKNINNEKAKTYAEKVEEYARKGLGFK